MKQHTFPLDREYVELHNLLKLLALASSGGEAKAMIGDGRVTVDGEIELRKTRKLRGGELVCIGEHEITIAAG